MIETETIGKKVLFLIVAVIGSQLFLALIGSLWGLLETALSPVFSSGIPFASMFGTTGIIPLILGFIAVTLVLTLLFKSIGNDR